MKNYYFKGVKFINKNILKSEYILHTIMYFYRHNLTIVLFLIKHVDLSAKVLLRFYHKLILGLDKDDYF